MTADKPAIDLAAVCTIKKNDIYASKLSGAYRAAVAAALPRGVNPPDEFWRELAVVVTGYVISQQNRASRRLPAVEIERFEQIVKWATAPGKQSLELASIRILAENQLAASKTISEDFVGKKNAHHEGLYLGILDLWCRGLGQKPGISRPHGPLIRFFNACTTPLLGKTFTASGVASIVTRGKARREKIARWKAATRAKLT